MKEMGLFFDWLILVADSHCSTAMGAGVLQFAGLEEVLHCRMTVWADHDLGIVVCDCGTLGCGRGSYLYHHHLALIAHHGSIHWR